MTNRRELMKLVALGGGAVYLSGLAGCAAGASLPAGAAAYDDFYFVQLSDAHWGFAGPPNPDAANTLRKAVATVNALETPPEFIVFTGDLTHSTDDPAERRRRLAGFREIVSALKVQPVYFLPGEHDAALDRGAAYQEFFGETHYSFDHKGVHFIAVDNVSDAGARLGDEQLAWMKADLDARPKDSPIVVLAHRPLFDLEPKWDWATRDGQQAIDILLQYPKVTVFYGHIHQENHHMTGHIAHHSARSLIFPLPAPGSQPQRTPLPWDPEHPNRGLGFREVQAEPETALYKIQEFGVTRA
ncbi:metallophosphoesterase family protein [Caenimonas terrae]|uniref:Metallophosphoesterase family protein n=1 Tax=Caenimonas terrae TaxID=696074 RepID=A0ABW0NEN0_9BURK